jgi:membrane fusion protein (multidrug efflux system)
LNRKSLKIVIFVSLLVNLTACDRFTDPGNKEAQGTSKNRSARPAHAVEIVMVSRQAIRIKRTLTGTLEAPRTVHIHSEKAGRIIELPFYEGDKVKKGALLVRLDDALLRAAIAKVVASRKQTEVDLKRLQKLMPNKLTTEDELARASTAVELARAEESLQRTLLSRTVIQSPFDGIISARLKEPSDVVSMNEHILTLFDPDIMTAAVQVPEQLHSRVSVGDAVKVRIDSLGDRSFSAKILRIHPVVNAQTRQGTVEVRLNPVPGSARPGQLCRVTLETAETPRLLIPLNALQFDSRGSFVYQLSDDSKVMHTAVTIGLQIGESIEIIDGVNDGDQIVFKGFLGLKSGKTVRVVKPVDGVSSVTADVSVPQEK